MSQLLPQEQKKAGFCRLLFVVIPFFITPFYPCIKRNYFVSGCYQSGLVFSCAKVLPRKNIQVPLRYLNTIFQQLSRFSIAQMSYTLHTATVKILSKFLACFSLKAILNARKNQIPTGKPKGFRKKGKKEHDV